MRLNDVIRALNLNVITLVTPDREISGGYASDLLSETIATARENEIWVTVQSHQNIIAVAVLKKLTAVIVAGGISPEATTRKKAESEEVNLLTTPLPTFEVVGQLFALGLRGKIR